VVVVLLFLALRKKKHLKKLRVVVLQNEIEVGIGVLDGKLCHVEEEIGLRVEEEVGDVVVVGKTIVK
jgi:hypothetical protein